MTAEIELLKTKTIKKREQLCHNSSARKKRWKDALLGYNLLIFNRTVCLLYCYKLHSAREIALKGESIKHRIPMTPAGIENIAGRLPENSRR